MIIFRHLLSAMIVLGGLCLLPGNARAETYNTCAGFIDSLPATISTQGVWCLRKDLATSMTYGNAIEITTNNVTIDCNDFKIGGLGAGNASITYGIDASIRQNIAVRHCNVRGFLVGINLSGGAGHLVEDNRLDNNLYLGINVTGDNSLVQRNRVFDTGGYPGSTTTYGIYTAGNILDNTVSGLFAIGTNTFPKGITASGSGARVRGNQVSGLAVAGATGYATGIVLNGANSTADGNQVTANAATAGFGIVGGTNGACSNNIVVNYVTNYIGCSYSFNNASLP